MRISQKTVADIKAQLRIEEVIGDFVTLKKRGSAQNLWTCCPFPGHQEQTPSFSVHAGKGFYKCFGCGEAGDAIDFLERIQGMAYPEALAYIAKKYHIPFVLARKNDKEDAEQRYKEGLYLLMDVATQYYEGTLKASPVAQDYLAKRGITAGLIEIFRLGYSPNAWQGLYNHATEEGYNTQQLLDAGLVVEKENNAVGDTFRHRITFPIFDTLGRVVGFGARTIENNQVKYINSPETTLYQKSHQLYGLYQAKEAIRKSDLCYVVEGYTDVLAMHGLGIKNVVASSGTAMTPQQVTLIKRFTPHVVLLFDGDEAGIKAIFRGVDLLLAQGLNVKIVARPLGEDPASYAQQLGKDAFVSYLQANQKDFVVFKWAHLHGNTDPEHKTNAIKNLLQSITLIPDKIQQAVYLDLLSRLTNIKKELLAQEITAVQHGQYTTTYQHSNQAAILSQLLRYGNKPHYQATSVASYIFNELEKVPFTDPHYEKIYDMLFVQWQKKGAIDHAAMLAETTDAIKKTVIDLMAEPYEMSHHWLKKGVAPQSERKMAMIIDKNIHYLKRECIQMRLDEEQQRLNALEKASDPGEELLVFNAYRKIQIEIERNLGIAVSKV